MRISILAAIAATSFVFTAAQAASDQGLAAAILNCSAQSDEKAQLACYNGIATQLKVQQAAAPAAAPAANAQASAQTPASSQTNAETPKQEGGAWYNPTTWFGSSEPPRPSRPMVGNPADFASKTLPESVSDAPKPLDHISAKVASVSCNYFRRFTVGSTTGRCGGSWKAIPRWHALTMMAARP